MKSPCFAVLSVWGEIYSKDNMAAGFCNFCGAATILAANWRRAVFARKELRNPKYIESLWGVYMPYWCHHVTQQGLLLLGKVIHHSGN